jgi:hypothetical protein
VQTKRIRMLRNGKGSPDGLRIEDYQKDVHYTVSVDLAEGFRLAGYAVIEGDVEPAPAPAPPPAIAPASEPVAKPSVSIAVPASTAAAPAAEKVSRRPRHLSGKQDRSLSSSQE